MGRMTTELMNYSEEQLKALIKPGVRIKSNFMEDIIELTGNEKIEYACGGEYKIGHHGIDSNKKEPLGIRLLSGTLISIGSIDEVLIRK